MRAPTAARPNCAIRAAADAFPHWSLTTPQRRADVLDQIGSEILARREELGMLLAREEGGTLPEAVGEAAQAGQIFKFFAGEALRCRAGRRCLPCGPTCWSTSLASRLAWSG